MFIKRSEYEELKSRAESNEDNAYKYTRLCESVVDEDRILVTPDLVLLHPNHLNKLSQQIYEQSNQIRELEAAVDWYKKEYFRLKLLVRPEPEDIVE